VLSTICLFSLSLHDALPICFMKKYRLSASHVLLASASLIVVMIVCLGIYQYCRAHVALKQQIFTISYKEEIPTSSAYYFEGQARSEEHTSELQSRFDLVCRL